MGKPLKINDFLLLKLKKTSLTIKKRLRRNREDAKVAEKRAKSMSFTCRVPAGEKHAVFLCALAVKFFDTRNALSYTPKVLSITMLLPPFREES